MVINEKLSLKHKIVKPTEAIAVLKAYYGMTGSPKVTVAPQKIPYEKAVVIAAGASDPTYFEVLVPTLVINDWEVDKVIAATETLPPQGSYIKARLHLAATILLGILSYSKLGIANVESLQTRLISLKEKLGAYTLENDPHFLSNNLPTSTASPYILELKGNMIWPLADFHKQLEWTIQKHYNES